MYFPAILLGLATLGSCKLFFIIARGNLVPFQPLEGGVIGGEGGGAGAGDGEDVGGGDGVDEGGQEGGT